MLKKTIKYTDYLGNPREEDFYFNLSKPELIALVAREEDLGEELQRVVRSGSGREIMDTFYRIIVMSYGIRSEDGRHFRKSETLSNDFLQSAAYEEFFMELVTNADAASAFINGLMPADLLAEAAKAAKEQKEAGRPKVPLEQLQAADLRASGRI